MHGRCGFGLVSNYFDLVITSIEWGAQISLMGMHASWVLFSPSKSTEHFGVHTVGDRTGEARWTVAAYFQHGEAVSVKCSPILMQILQKKYPVIWQNKSCIASAFQALPLDPHWGSAAGYCWGLMSPRPLTLPPHFYTSVATYVLGMPRVACS